MHNTTLQLVKKDGVLVPASEQEHSKLKLYTMSIKEGDVVDTYLSIATPADKTLPQLAKVHSLIRELAEFTGHTFEEIKDEIKNKAGLYVITGTRSGDKKFKSFGDCSKDELSKAIEICIQTGNSIGCTLY